MSTIRDRLEKFIGHWVTDTVVMVLIVVSVTLIVVEVTLPPTSALIEPFRWADFVITGIFVVELSIRYYVARRKNAFFRKYWLDILSVVPVMRSLRFLRLVRLLRIFRMGLLLNRRISSSTAMFRSAAGEYLIVAVIIVLTILLGAIGLRVTEGVTNPAFGSLEQTAWWSVLSMIAGEPIGEPVTSHMGRVFTLMVMLSGMTVFAIFTGTVSAVMVSRLKNLNLRDMDLQDLNHHTLVCGWNRSGRRLLSELSKDVAAARRGIVIVAEFDEDDPPLNADVEPGNIFFVRGDYTQISVLKECGAKAADVAILLADRTKDRSDQDRDARSVLAAVAIERMNPDIFTSVELTNRENGEHLRVMGVEEIVVAYEYTGSIIAMAAKTRGMMRILEELLTAQSGNEFHKVPIAPHMAGWTVSKVATMLHDEFSATLIAVESLANGDERKVAVNPGQTHELVKGDHLVVIATDRPALK